MTFSMGTTPAAASPPVDGLEDGPEAGRPARRADVAERGEDGVLGERAGLAGVGDGSRRRCGHRLGRESSAGATLLVEPVGRVDARRRPRRARRAAPGPRRRTTGAFARARVAGRGRGLRRRPRQCASASIALSATMYASIDAAMMFGPRASPAYSPSPRSPAAAAARSGPSPTPTVSVPSPRAWMS